jgi:glycine dehydrogenase subunit 1
LEIDGDPEKVLAEMKGEKIIGGLPLAKFYPELNRHLLVTVTEMNSKEEIDRWAKSLGKALRE